MHLEAFGGFDWDACPKRNRVRVKVRVRVRVKG